LGELGAEDALLVGAESIEGFAEGVIILDVGHGLRSSNRGMDDRVGRQTGPPPPLPP